MTGVDLTIPPHRIQWRVGSTFKRGSKLYGQLLAYIDARTVMERLDLLDPEWTVEHYSPVTVLDSAGKEATGIPCRLTVRGVGRTDVGVPSDMEPVKGAYSDALKRAAVHFGIGRELYEMPFVAVECEEKSNGKAGKPLALPTFNKETGLWEIDSQYGFIRYSEVADDAEAAPKASSTKPVKPRGKAKSGEDLATDKQRQLIFGRARKAGIEPKELTALVYLATGKRSSKQLTSGDVDTMLEAIEDEEMVEKAKANAQAAENNGDRVPIVTP